MNELKFFKVGDGAVWPSRGTELSAGIDFYVPSCNVGEDDELYVYMRSKINELGNSSQKNELSKLNSKSKSRYFWELVVLYNKVMFNNELLWYMNDDVFFLANGCNVVIPSGITANIPHGYAIVMKNKSGIATKKGLDIGACLIDEDYTGIMHIDMHNNTRHAQPLECGKKIIQGMLIQTNLEVPIKCMNGNNDKGKTERGAGGFGSTGV